RGRPPPAMPASEVEWCGARKGGPASSASRASVPAALWMRVASSAAEKSSGGRIPGRRRASSVLPRPGGPTKSRLCPPAAASARRAGRRGGGGRGGGGRRPRGGKAGAREPRLAAQPGERRPEALGRERREARTQRRLAEVADRDDDLADRRALGSAEHREHPA